MRLARRFCVLLLAATAGLAPAACGYSSGTLVPEGYRTIAVPIFYNETRRHDLEFEVTRAVVEELQARTNLRVVAEDQSPDLVLRGILREVDEETLSRRAYQRPRENAIFVTAEVDVIDRKTDAHVVKNEKVHEREAFAPATGEDVRSARAEATRSLAERIVRTLESSW